MASGLHGDEILVTSPSAALADGTVVEARGADPDRPLRRHRMAARDRSRAPRRWRAACSGPTTRARVSPFRRASRPRRTRRPAPPLDAAWWTLFGDPTLTALEEQARGANQDVQVALARVCTKSRAAARVTESQFYPVVTFDPNFTAERLSPNRPSRPATRSRPSTSRTSRSPSTSSYELDLWGKIRRSVESSMDTALATEYDAAVVRSRSARTWRCSTSRCARSTRRSEVLERRSRCSATS